MSALKYNGRWYIQGVYCDIARSKRLSALAKATWLVLMSFVSKTSPKPFPSLRTLGDLLQLNPETVKNKLNELEEQGLLKQERRTGYAGRYASNSYTLYDNFDFGCATKDKVAIRDHRDGLTVKVYPSRFNRDGQSVSKKRPVVMRNSPSENSLTPGDKKIPPAIPAPSAAGVLVVANSLSREGAAPPSPPAPTFSPEAIAEAQRFIRTWPRLTKKIKGYYVQVDVISQDRIKLWFDQHPEWKALDVLWVSFQGMLLSEETPRPAKGAHDRYFYSRFTHSLRWFFANKDGSCKVEAAAEEVSYYRNMEYDEICHNINAYLEGRTETAACS